MFWAERVSAADVPGVPLTISWVAKLSYSAKWQEKTCAPSLSASKLIVLIRCGFDVKATILSRTAITETDPALFVLRA